MVFEIEEKENGTFCVDLTGYWKSLSKAGPHDVDGEYQITIKKFEEMGGIRRKYFILENGHEIEVTNNYTKLKDKLESQKNKYDYHTDCEFKNDKKEEVVAFLSTLNASKRKRKRKILGKSNKRQKYVDENDEEFEEETTTPESSDPVFEHVPIDDHYNYNYEMGATGDMDIFDDGTCVVSDRMIDMGNMENVDEICILKLTALAGRNEGVTKWIRDNYSAELSNDPKKVRYNNVSRRLTKIIDAREKDKKRRARLVASKTTIMGRIWKQLNTKSLEAKTSVDLRSEISVDNVEDDESGIVEESKENENNTFNHRNFKVGDPIWNLDHNCDGEIIDINQAKKSYKITIIDDCGETREIDTIDENIDKIRETDGRNNGIQISLNDYVILSEENDKLREENDKVREEKDGLREENDKLREVIKNVLVKLLMNE